MCHKDIAWSDLLTEAVYSTHLREKPDQGPSCLECNQFLWWNFSRQNDRFSLAKHGGVEDVDRDCMRLLTVDQLRFPLN